MLKLGGDDAQGRESGATTATCSRRHLAPPSDLTPHDVKFQTDKSNADHVRARHLPLCTWVWSSCSYGCCVYRRWEPDGMHASPGLEALAHCVTAGTKLTVCRVCRSLCLPAVSSTRSCFFFVCPSPTRAVAVPTLALERSTRPATTSERREKKSHPKSGRDRGRPSGTCNMCAFLCFRGPARALTFEKKKNWLLLIAHATHTRPTHPVVAWFDCCAG